MTPDELEKRINRDYYLAYKEIQQEAKEYFGKLKDRISMQQLRLERGEIDGKYYKQWLLNQVGRGERWLDLKQKISDRLIDAKQTAVEYINDTTPGVYALNRNYQAYQIDTAMGPQDGVSWTAWDEQTVKRLLTEDRQLVPLARTNLNINKAETWNKQHIQSALTSAILTGKDVGKLADSFEALALMDRNSSLRNARTALTGAQNAGRQEAYREADEMGISIQKEWICTQDDRTRDSHIELDGQIVDQDKPFVTSDGHEIMYPGDPTAEPCEVWNCRCTVRAILPKHDVNQRRITYDDWINRHTISLNDEKEYMAAFVPKTDIDDKIRVPIQLANMFHDAIDVYKVKNSDYDMYVSKELLTRKNKAIIVTEKILHEFEKTKAETEIPRVVIIDFYKNGMNPNALAAYNGSNDTLYVNSQYDSIQKIEERLSREPGHFANTEYMSTYEHELNGHKKDWDYIKEVAKRENMTYDEVRKERTEELFDYFKRNISEDRTKQMQYLSKNISAYATKNFIDKDVRELIAECATIPDKKLAKEILDIYYGRAK